MKNFFLTIFFLFMFSVGGGVVYVFIYTISSYNNMWKNANPAGTKYVIHYKHKPDTIVFRTRSILVGRGEQNMIMSEDINVEKNFTTTAHIEPLIPKK